MTERKFTCVEDQLPGPESARLLEMGLQYEAQCAGYQAPLVWDHAEGVVVTDVDGNRYIDWTSGVLVTNLGHSHPDHVAAIQRAVGRLMNCYDFPTPERVNAARELVEIAPDHLTRAFFLTTGSEATEAAIRVAKRFTGNFEIISFFGGFHGRTYAAMSVAGLAATKKQFGPLMPGVIRVPFPYCYRCGLNLDPETCSMECFDLLETTARYSSTGSLAGLIIEPYQGAAGFVFAPDGYLKRVERWCADNDVVFILDEVQSSFGRTGKMLMLEWEGLKPQLVCVGKGIGSGIPTSALLAQEDVIGALSKGEMSSTCGGNPVSSAACLAALDIIAREGLCENALRIGAIIKERLLEIQERCPYLGDVRGMGMVMGLEFVQDKQSKEPAPDITRRVIDTAAQHGVLVGAVGIFGNVIRVAPPLVMSEEEAHESLDTMEDVLTTL